MNTVELEEMSVSEKLKTMEILWSCLVEKGSDVESPTWHGDVIAARKASIEDGTAELVPFEKLDQYRR